MNYYIRVVERTKGDGTLEYRIQYRWSWTPWFFVRNNFTLTISTWYDRLSVMMYRDWMIEQYRTRNIQPKPSRWRVVG